MNLRRALLQAAERLWPQVSDLDALQTEAKRHLLAAAPAAEAGALHEALTGLKLALRAGRLHVISDRRKHRETGRYYTVAPVVNYMVEAVCKRLPPHPKVLDPAAGSGAFLEALVGRAEVWGVDTDPQALALCKESAPGARLIEADALTAEIPGGFDAVVGNPPYIATGLRGARAAPPDQALLRKLYPEAAQYKLNTYPLFIQRGLDLLRPGGILAFIVPDSLLTGRYFARLRTKLMEQTTILELILIREDFWPHGKVGQSLVLLLQKRAPPTTHQVVVKTCDTLADLEGQGALVPQRQLCWGLHHRWRLVGRPEDLAFLQQMEHCPTKLSDLVQSYSGLIGRRGQQSLLAGPTPSPNAPTGKLLRSGKEIDRYQLNWGGEHVLLEPTLIKSGGKLDYYRRPKLLLRQTADTIRAVYDDQAFFCLNNIHLLRPRHDGVDLHYVLAVLNSAPMDRYYRLLTMETGRLYPQVDLDLLGEMPLPDASHPQVTALADLARQRTHASGDAVLTLEQQIDQSVMYLYGLA